MSAAENSAMVRRFIEETFNQRDFDAVDRYMAPDYVDHVVPPDVPATREGFKQFATLFLGAFPDFHYTIDDEIAEGDRVVHHLTAQGTHTADLPGLPATGKRATWSEIHIGRVVDGKLVEHWGVTDQLSMLQQLGAMPMPEQASI